MIYFDENEQAYNTPVEGYIATCDETRWAYFSEHPDEWDIINGEFTDLRNTEEYKAKKQVEEKERIGNLSMTRGDVFEALILARGITKAQIRAMIEQAELDDITKALYLNRFEEALDFYRGFPVFDMLGQELGVTPKQLDMFFTDKNYKHLLPVVQQGNEEENIEVNNG